MIAESAVHLLRFQRTLFHCAVLTLLLITFSIPIAPPTFALKPSTWQPCSPETLGTFHESVVRWSNGICTVSRPQISKMSQTHILESEANSHVTQSE